MAELPVGDPVEPPTRPMMTLCEVLTWIAFRRAVSYEGLDSAFGVLSELWWWLDETEPVSFVTPIDDDYEARRARVKSDPTNRIIREKIAAAKAHVKDAAAAGQLTVHAIEVSTVAAESGWELRKRMPDQLARELFLIPAMSLHESGSYGSEADEDFPVDGEPYTWLPKFRNLQFRTQEVLAKWTLPEGNETATGSDHTKPVTHTRGRGGAPARHDWDAFWIEVAIWCEPNGFGPGERTRLQAHMTEWAAINATNPDNPLNPSTIRKKLKALFTRANPTT